jgi:SAM-dependent methyltransferase
MTEPTAAASAPAAGGDFNVLPYISKPFPQSAPARLAALATLFGLSPPAVSEARVLELGCASGGNIIPLALRFPGARFLGVDLAERHVQEGRERIDALELKNIRLEADLTTLDLKGERFDYIICHGVYSWVPEAAREAILRIVGESLADNGVAYLSYNVYPGWQLRNVVRDMMVYHAGPEAGEDAAGQDRAPADARAHARSARLGGWPHLRRPYASIRWPRRRPSPRPAGSRASMPASAPAGPPAPITP